jgi:Xaa-Pro aminopeptidase
MRVNPIEPELFSANRNRFAAKMKPKSLAVFVSNDIYPTSADGTMNFVQHSDIYYLSGVYQEETVLVIFPDAPDAANREILFVRETNEIIKIWEGEKLTKEKACELTGIKNVKWLSEYKKTLYLLMIEAESVYLNTNEHRRADVETETREARLIHWFKEHYPLHQYERSSPILHELRAIKSKEEVNRLQTACDITEKAFRRLLKFIKPGVWEHHIEAEIMHEFLMNKASGMAYGAIIAAGNNANVLHYVENDKECKAGDIILMDFGAEYAAYNADLTRVVPVSGKFTERQKKVYNAVLHVHNEAANMLVAGNMNLFEYEKEVGKIMTEQLIQLGLIDKTDIKNQNPDAPLYKKYFMHGTSHPLGINVHDYGNYYRKFAAGMVFTCEPGIYIPEEGFGIRLENDWLITENGNINLMANIPILADEIEDLMN